MASFLLWSFGTSRALGEECPLDLPLAGSPDAVLQRLEKLPTMNAQREPARKPLFGQCDYKISSLMQFNAAPEGMCSIAGQPVIGSALEIVDSASAISGQSYVVPMSENSLAALKRALGKMASPLSLENYPSSLRNRRDSWLTDAVFTHNDEYWIVSHAYWAPGETHTAPDIYTLLHVRKSWLEFAMRDTNKCTALPVSR